MWLVHISFQYSLRATVLSKRPHPHLSFTTSLVLQLGIQAHLQSLSPYIAYLPPLVTIHPEGRDSALVFILVVNFNVNPQLDSDSAN